MRKKDSSTLKALYKSAPFLWNIFSVQWTLSHRTQGGVATATIQALKHFPVHFAAIDATWSLDGPLGYKEGFDRLRDDDGKVIRKGNIHRTDTSSVAVTSLPWKWWEC